MARPTLTINGHDYAQYVEKLSISRNDLDADGSGRDVQTGEMFRTRIASKMKIEVSMLRLPQSVHRQLLADISPVFYSATVIDPETGSATTRSFYSSTVPFGAQRYNREMGAPEYIGMTFSMTER